MATLRLSLVGLKKKLLVLLSGHRGGCVAPPTPTRKSELAKEANTLKAGDLVGSNCSIHLGSAKLDQALRDNIRQNGPSAPRQHPGGRWALPHAGE
jgi:hypothetical protein